MFFTTRQLHTRPVATRALSVALAVVTAATGALPAAIGPRTVYAAGADDVTPPPPPPDQTPIVGFIDTHLHQFANLGFGGFEVWGSPMDPTLDPTAPLDAARARALPDSDFIYVADDQIGAIQAAFGIPVAGTPSASHGNFPGCPTADACYQVTIHGVAGGADLLNAQITNQNNHSTTGYRPASGPPSMGWPTYHTVTTQQAYWEWLERAHDHGLKMITMTAVNNTVLCNMGIGLTMDGCDDDSAVDRQIQGAKDLETYIDARAGGPGQGFYKIVYNAADARAAIAAGKLAVNLGVEVDTPFSCISTIDCSPVVDALVQHYDTMGVRVVYPVHVVDNAFGGTALYDDLFEFNNYLINSQHFWDVTTACNLGDPQPVTWRDHVRDIFTDGLKLGALAGLLAAAALVGPAIAIGAAFGPLIGAIAGILSPVLAAAPLLSLLVTVAAVSSTAALALLPLLADLIAHYGPVGNPTDPNCNARGLSPAGTALVNALIDHKMMIDVDHTDRLTFNGILDIAEARHYPGIVSGHTGLAGAARVTPLNGAPSVSHEGNKTDQMVQRITNLGGFISLIPHQSDRNRIVDVSSNDNIPFDCGNSSESWAQVYLYATETLHLPAVGIGSDFNGFAQWSAPRFGPNACDGDHDAHYAPTNPVKYGPALADYYGQPLDQYTFGSRTWDFNTEGLAHVGLYPDFIADLQATGLGDKLGPLFNSTEAYVKMWEKVDDDAPPVVQCGTVGSSWHGQNVSVPCNAYDTGYGLTSPSDASFTLSTDVADGTETASASTGPHAAICDAGGHCTGVVPAITGIKVDRKGPNVVSNTPPAGVPSYTLNQVVTADYSCSDGGSGIAVCTAPVATGSALSTSVGPHAFTVHAADAVGNLTDVSHPYNVSYGVCALYDQTKVKNAGSTVPITLQLCTVTGANVSSAAIALQATAVTRISTMVSGVPDDSGNANPDNVFRYDATLHGYIFNLSTKGYLTGTYSLSFTVAGDPVTHNVQFGLR